MKNIILTSILVVLVYYDMYSLPDIRDDLCRIIQTDVSIVIENGQPQWVNTVECNISDTHSRHFVFTKKITDDKESCQNNLIDKNIEVKVIEYNRGWYYPDIEIFNTDEYNKAKARIATLYTLSIVGKFIVFLIYFIYINF